MSHDEEDTTSDGPQALQVVQRLANVLEQRLPQRSPADADDFADVLKKLDEIGLHFDEFGVLEALSDTSQDLVRALAKRHPTIPREVSHLVDVLLSGVTPASEIVGDSDTESLGKKLAAIENYVLNEELKDRYFVRRMSKAPVVTDLDWGVGIRTAERGWKGDSGIPFAELALTLTSYNRIDGPDDVVHACVDEAMLSRLVDQLSDALAALRRTKQVARQIDLRSKKED